MKRYPVIILALFFVFCAAATADQTEEVLSWADCVLEVRGNNPELISTREILNQTIANKAIIQSDILPQIKASLSGTRQKRATGALTESYQYGFNGKQLIFDGFKIWNKIGAATQEIRAVQYDYDAVSSNVRLRLRKAFVSLLKAYDLLEITEDIAQRRQQNLEMVQLRYEAGREHKGALLTAQADLAEARYEVAVASRSIELSQRDLIKELGRSRYLPIKPEGSINVKLPHLPKPDFEDLAVYTPFLNELVARKEAAKLNVNVARSYFFPEVYADAGVAKHDSDWPPRGEEWSVGLSVSLPLFEGGRRIADVKKAQAGLRKAQADEQGEFNSVVYTLSKTWIDLENAIDNVMVKEQYLVATEERARIARAQYANGLISFDTWIIIEDDLVRAKKNYLTVQAETLIARAYWVQAKGGTLEND